jgi:hypothetical protein
MSPKPQDKNKFGFIDTTGKMVIAPEFYKVGNFVEGLAKVGFYRPEGYVFGFINKAGKYEINPQFDAAFDFSEGYAPVKFGGKWGVIDRSGKYVIPPQFDTLYAFKSGLMQAKRETKFGYINETGEFVWSTDLPQLETVFSRLFFGKIDRLEIQMRLERNGEDLFGVYAYKNIGMEIRLRGKIDKENNIILNELDEQGNVSATFKGTFIAPDLIQGKWTKGNKTLPFELQESEIEMSEGN